MCRQKNLVYRHPKNAVNFSALAVVDTKGEEKRWHPSALIRNLKECSEFSLAIVVGWIQALPS